MYLLYVENYDRKGVKETSQFTIIRLGLERECGRCKGKRKYNTWRVTDSKDQETTQDLRDAHNASSEDNQGNDGTQTETGEKREIMI